MARAPSKFPPARRADSKAARVSLPGRAHGRGQQRPGTTESGSTPKDPDKARERGCLVTDVIQNSHENHFVALSPTISDALKALKAFNLERIYKNPKSKVHAAAIQRLFCMLFDMRLADLETNNRSSDIFSGFLADMSDAYTAAHSNPEIVRDYIAGMTDRYFLHQFPEHLRPVAK